MSRLYMTKPFPQLANHLKNFCAPFPSFSLLPSPLSVFFRLALHFPFQNSRFYFNSTMEAMKMKVLVAVILMLMAVSAVQIASAADAPAPAPASDASIFVPTVFASLVALVFGMLF